MLSRFSLWGRGGCGGGAGERNIFSLRIESVKFDLDLHKFSTPPPPPNTTLINQMYTLIQKCMRTGALSSVLKSFENRRKLFVLTAT